MYTNLMYQYVTSSLAHIHIHSTAKEILYKFIKSIGKVFLLLYLIGFPLFFVAFNPSQKNMILLLFQFKNIKKNINFDFFGSINIQCLEEICFNFWYKRKRISSRILIFTWDWTFLMWHFKRTIHEFGFMELS